MIAAVLLFLALVAGLRWPGALFAGTLFTYQAEALGTGALDIGPFSGEWLGPAYFVLAAFVALYHALRHGRAWHVTRLDFAVIALLVGCFMAISYAPWPRQAADAAVKLLVAFGVMYAIGRFSFQDPDKVLREFLAFTAGFGGIFSLLLIMNRATDFRLSQRLYLENNADASVVGISQAFPFVLLACLVLLYLSRNTYTWVLASVAGIVALYASFLSSTRGVFVALAAGILVFFMLLAPHVRIGRVGRLAIFALGGLMLLLIFAPSEQIDRSFNFLTRNLAGGGLSLDDPSSRERLAGYNYALGMFYDAPILGHGYDSYAQFTHGAYPHNMFLEFASERGMLGLALLIGWLATLASTIWVIYRRWPLAGAVLAAMTMTAFAHMQLSFSFYMGRPLFLFTAIAACAAAMLQRQSANPGTVTRRKFVSP